MDDDLATLDEALARIRFIQQRPSWHRRLLSDTAHGLSVSEVRLLRAVERRVSAGESPSIGDVADDLAIEHSTASRAATGAEQRGLIDKVPCDDDQRKSRLQLTSAGRAAMAETTARRLDIVREALDEWSGDELATLSQMLVRLADDLDGTATT